MDDQLGLTCVMEAGVYVILYIPEFVVGGLACRTALDFVHQIPGLVRFARHGACIYSTQCEISGLYT